MSFLNIEVPEKGEAHITGFISSKDEKQSLKDVVGKIPGISKTKFDVAVIPPGA